MTTNFNQSTYSCRVQIDIESKALFNLMKLDKKQIGTKEYLGIAYFWHHEYRHFLRDASARKRKKIHNLFIQNNIPMKKENGSKYFDFTKKGLKICEEEC